MFEEQQQELQPPVEAVEPGVGAEPTSQETTSPAPDKRQPDAKPQINLDELPEFRRFKSEQDKRFTQMEKAHRQQLAEAEQRRQWLEQQMEERQLAGMDDLQKLQYQNQKLQRQMQEQQQRYQQEEINRSKYEYLQRISQATKIPMEELWQLDDPADALRIGFERLAQQASAQGIQAQQQDKRERNAVDTGGGSSRPAAEWDEQIAKAYKDGDVQRYMKLLRERDQK